MDIMDPNFSWIYLIFFLAIPLARIIPRIIARRRTNNPDQKFQNNFESKQEQTTEFKPEKSRPKTKNMLVLGELNRGTKTFEGVQKNTGLDTDELNKILENLEGQGLLKVQQKQGLFGEKIELHPTEKGFREYYS